MLKHTKTKHRITIMLASAKLTMQWCKLSLAVNMTNDLAK